MKILIQFDWEMPVNQLRISHGKNVRIVYMNPYSRLAYIDVDELELLLPPVPQRSRKLLHLSTGLNKTVI